MKKKALLAGGAGVAAVAATVAGISGILVESAVQRQPHLPKLGASKEADELRMEIGQRIEEAKTWVMEQKQEKLSISSYDGLRLSAVFLPAEEDTGRTVLAVHGYRNYGMQEYAAMAPFYHRLGYNMLLVDDRGHGESEGDYVCYGWQDHFDCEKWIDYLVERFGQKAQIFLYGISMGAATVMMTAGDELPPQVKGIISDCGYTTAMEQFRYTIKNSYHLPTSPFLPLARLMAKKRTGYDFEDCNAKEALTKAKLPFLFIHGDEDDFVPTAMGYENYEACASKEKELLLIEGAGHAQSYFVDTRRYETAVRNFLEKWSEEE